MNKIELNRLSQVNNNEQNFLAALNENLKRIQEAINDTLSRTGVKPNQMEEVLDMNGNRICNVGPAVELTDVVTKQDIQNIIDAANEAIARLDGLVEAGRVALMNYAQEYIYPTVTAALDGAQAAQRAAEAARDALLLNPDYQALTQNLPTIMTLVDNITVLENIRDNMTELLAVSDDLTNIDAVAADLTNLDAIAGNLEEILRSSTYAQQAAQSASQASTSASNAANSATAAAGSATAAAGSATTATNKANEASASATAASGSASNAADSATAAASSVTTAANKANTARIWAEGTDGEVVPLGGSHSAKVWAQYVEEIIAGTRIFGGSFDASTATATLTSAAKAKLGTDANTIVLTNDTTPITGYAANEAIEYVVTVDGTFAGMTLKVNDILWSSGLSWYKIDNSETVIADATESVKGIAALASTAEAEAGANDTKIMTPLKTKQAILELAPAPADASTSTKGVLQLANNAEAAAGSNETKAMTPETTKKAIATQTYNNLNASQRATLLSNGTYMGDEAANNRIFETDVGTFEKYYDDQTNTWGATRVTLPSSQRWIYVRESNGKLFIFPLKPRSSSTTMYSAYTDDGVTWSLLNTPRAEIQYVAYGNGRYVFAASESSGYKTFYSEDLVTFYNGDNTLPYASWVGMDFIDGKFVLFSDYGSVYYTSVDGVTWTAVTITSYNSYFGSFKYHNGLYLLAGKMGSSVFYSTDGVNWTRNSDALDGANYYDDFLAYGNGIYVLVGSNYNAGSTNKYYYSTDGINWTPGTLPFSAPWSGVTYGDGKFVAIAGWNNNSQSRAAYSTDGINWTAVDMSASDTWYGCGYLNGHFISSRYYSYDFNYANSLNPITLHDRSLTPLSYTKSEVDTALASKQGTLTAGANITIDSDNVISATGGGGSASYDAATQEITLG